MKAFFVAGTDTDVGKTHISCSILHAANRKGLSTMGLKPFSAGCEEVDGELRNDDAIRLMSAMSTELAYSQVNPVALKEPCSPHIAAAKAGRAISAGRVVGVCRGSMMSKPDLCLVEGAGGWLVPISPRETMADFAKKLDLPVILVVGLKLGCLNHALLTAQAIRASGLELVGWVGNQLAEEPMLFQEENIQTLRVALDRPCLGITPYQKLPDSKELSEVIDLDCLDL